MGEKIMNALVRFAGILQSQRHFSAIKDDFQDLLPIIIGESLCRRDPGVYQTHIV